MSLRSEFVALARQPGSNISDLCRRYGISRKTGYKWLGRQAPLKDQPRRPHDSPGRTDPSIEALLLATRGNASSILSPMRCGKWISKGTCR
jgi:transposase-like protein